MRRIALLERGTRVACREALGLGLEERDEAAREVAGIPLAETCPPDVPSRVGAQRDLHVRVPESVDGVAVGIDLRDEHRVPGAWHRGFPQDAGHVLHVELPASIEEDLRVHETGQGDRKSTRLNY